MCDSTASQSLSFTAFHIKRSYCSTPVAAFQPGFFYSFQIDCEWAAERRATASTSAKSDCDFMRGVYQPCSLQHQPFSRQSRELRLQSLATFRDFIAE